MGQVAFADLEPEWVRVGERGWQRVPTLAEAQGVFFLCPTCFVTNHGPIGTHGFLIWSRARGTPEETTPRGRWGLEGTDASDLSITGEKHEPDNPEGKRSVALLDYCKAHFSVTQGRVDFHEDNGR